MASPTAAHSSSPSPDLIPKSQNAPEGLSFHSLSGRTIVADVVKKLEESPTAHFADRNFISERLSQKLRTYRKIKVCIVGAGVSGMRIAMFLDYLKINYDILEASDRHGGRVFTHNFSKADHDYYDVGAMRFPYVKALEQTFKLFKELGLKTGPGGKVIPYIMSTPNNFQLFNDVAVTNHEAATKDNPHNDTGIPLACLTHTFKKYKGAKAIFEEAMDPYKKALAEDFQTGWQKLMKVDHFTTRNMIGGFLIDKKLVPDRQHVFWVVQWMERMTNSTGSYDFAFSDEVLESMEFDYPNGFGQPPLSDEISQNWFCIDGGTEVVTDRMHEKIKKKLNYSHRVVSVRADSPLAGNTARTQSAIPLGSDACIESESIIPPFPDTPPLMFVEVRGYPEFKTKAKIYDHIVLTTPLSCVNRMDLTQAQLTERQKEGIRSLGYGPAVKIGIKFKTRWWETLGEPIQIRGCSYTDRPIRVVVYPSYGRKHREDSSGVLIASYAWTQDASRLGADIQGTGSVAEENLLDIVYNNLEAIHFKSNQKNAQWYKEQTISHFAHDWYHDQFSVGAYAHFHPGQFSSTYPEMTKPAAKGYLHFSGEAMSAHHAWIEGALVSAWRSVYQILTVEGNQLLVDEFCAKWPPPDEIDIEIEPKQVARGCLGLDDI